MPWRFNPFTGNLDETDIPAFNGEVTPGSAASPSIFFTGDPNTGLYSPGEDQVAISTNGAERLRVTATGLGLGTSAPGALLHAVNTSAGAATLGAFIQNASSTTGTEIRLGFSPNSSPVSENRYAYIGSINVLGSTDNSLTFGTGAGEPATERLRIKSTGIINVSNTPVYADNATAKTGGLVDGDIYRKSDGTLMIVYT